MKFRQDFVTNSSSASYIICFARVEDEEKAKQIIDKHKLYLYTANEIKSEMRWGYLGADWAGAYAWDANKVIKEYPDSKFILIEECLDAEYGDAEEDWEPIYDYCFDCNDTIAEITKENGFTNIEVSEGEGRNG